MWYAVVFK
jgi:hypothetical protein